MTSIKYIAFYDVPNTRSKRIFSPAAASKIEYIASALNRAHLQVSIISPSWFDKTEEKVSFKFAQKHTIKDNIELVRAPSFGGNNKFFIYAKILLSLSWLFFYLVFNTRKNEKIVVYHSIWICFPILMAQRIRKFKIILEVEEIYQDVKTLHSFFDEWENKIIKSADSYLLSTDLLKEKLTTKKPTVVIYGSYFVEKIINQPPDDNKIHLLYAGIIDTEKRGAINALESAKYLPENYILHIIGFGDIEMIENLVEKHNKTAECKAYFHGEKKGEEYIAFCQGCHIGLSTQKMDGAYLASSFPSKILSYLGMGLRVISSNIKCVSISTIGHLITYYNEDTPQGIANAIIKINIFEDYNSLDVIAKNDLEFLNDIKRILY